MSTNEYRTISLTQKFKEQKDAADYATKTVAKLTDEGWSITSMSIRPTYLYKKDYKANPVQTGWLASLSGQVGNLQQGDEWEEDEAETVVPAMVS